MKQPISTYSALAYPLASIPIVLVDGANPRSLVMWAALVFLGLTTAVFHRHWSPFTARLDHAGMNACFAVLATLAAGGPWFLALAAGIAAAWVLEYVLDLHNWHLMGIFVWVGLVAAFGAGEWQLTGLAVLTMGGGFLLRDEGDIGHGVWHVLTAIGIVFLYLGAV